MNHSAFDDPLSIEARYWIGMLMADGCVGGGYNPRVVQLGLTDTDADHLEKLKTFLDAKTKIYFAKQRGYKSSKGSAIFSFSSERIVAQLAKYGVVPRKSMKESAHVDLLFDRDFWRGAVDGDGSVLKSRVRPDRWRPWIQLCGSRRLVTQFQGFVESITFTRFGIQTRESGFSTLAVAGFKGFQVIKALYQDSCVSLNRKMICAEECFDWIPRQSRSHHRWKIHEKISSGKNS